MQPINKLAFDSGLLYATGTRARPACHGPRMVCAGTIEGKRLGKLPNYDEDAYIKASYLFNTTLQYDFTDHMRGSLTITNLFDKNPVKDPTYASYPYYDISWFDSVGRSFYMQLTYKLGGAGL